MKRIIYTCGHSTRPFEDLVKLLTDNGITVLADVRAMPRSRFYPWFNRSYLEKNLPVKYRWFEALGGKNSKEVPPAEFAAALDALIALADTETVCIMCSERSPLPSRSRPEGCHRWTTLTPALEARGMTVQHLV